MKISAILTLTNPDERQDPWRECIYSCLELFDEVIIVNGGKPLPGLGAFKAVKEIIYPWPKDWSWEELPKHLNRGLEEAAGDWVCRVDADYVFPAGQRDLVEKELTVLGGTPVATMQKFSAVLWNKFYQKGGIRMLINKKASNVKFGKDPNKYTDLCVPIYSIGEENGVPIGQAVPGDNCGKTHGKFFNYDYTFKTEGFTRKEFLRFSLAHKKYFGTTNWGETEEASLEKFLNMMQGRLKKCVYTYGIGEQPISIRSKLETLDKSHFGFGGWGKL